MKALPGSDPDSNMKALPGSDPDRGGPCYSDETCTPPSVLQVERVRGPGQGSKPYVSQILSIYYVCYLNCTWLRRFMRVHYCSRKAKLWFGLVNNSLFLIQKWEERIRETHRIPRTSHLKGWLFPICRDTIRLCHVQSKMNPLCHTSTDSLSPPTHLTIVGQLITHSPLLII
jgi:hypothetical protein